MLTFFKNYSKNKSEKINLKKYKQFNDNNNNNNIVTDLNKLVKITKKKLEKKHNFIYSLINYEYYASNTNNNEYYYIIEKYEYLKYEFDQFKNSILKQITYNNWLINQLHNSIDMYEQNNLLNDILLNSENEKEFYEINNISNLQLKIIELHTNYLNNCLNFEISKAEILFQNLYNLRTNFLDYLSDIKSDITLNSQISLYINNDLYDISYKSLKIEQFYLLSCNNYLDLHKNDETILKKIIKYNDLFLQIKIDLKNLLR